MLQRLLFRMARSPWMGRVVGMAFQYAGWAVPVRKVIRSRDVLVFRHPRPAYANHLILSPKRAVRNLQQMQHLSVYFEKIWSAAMAVRTQHAGIYDSFTLAANGGKRQEVQQVHFHMFTDHPMVSGDAGDVRNGKVIYQDECLCIWEHPQPEWDVHLVLKPAGSSADAYFRGVLQSIERLDTSYGIVQKGYSLVYQHSPEKDGQKCPVFHVVSGAKHR